jgi:predicted protein tyrosine phosphatase
MKVLFVCSRNRLRSPTAEAIFSTYEGLEVSSAGTNVDAESVISADLIEWADIIFAMEGVHRKRLNKRFGKLLRATSIVVLGIPDKYKYMDPELVMILKQKVSQHLQRYDVSDEGR